MAWAGAHAAEDLEQEIVDEYALAMSAAGLSDGHVRHTGCGDRVRSDADGSVVGGDLCGCGCVPGRAAPAGAQRVHSRDPGAVVPRRGVERGPAKLVPAGLLVEAGQRCEDCLPRWLGALREQKAHVPCPGGHVVAVG